MLRFSIPAALALTLAACSGSHTAGDGGASADAGPDPVVQECSVPADCVVIPVSCCGSCGAPTRGDAIAVNRSRTGDFYGDRCSAIDCPACAAMPDPTLLATCTAGRCEVVDLRMHAATECAADTDCRVRAAECCPCGATITESTVVAVADSAAYASLVCEPGMGCPECEPAYPDEFGARCDAGRCVFVVE